MKTNNDTTVPKVKLILEWLIHIITYAVILLLISLFSKTIVIDKACYVRRYLLLEYLLFTTGAAHQQEVGQSAARNAMG